MKIAFLRNVKLNKTWVVLGVSLVIGLLAALAARSYLSNQVAAIEARSKAGKVNLVVAAHDLRKGEKLNAENVAIRPIPTDYAHSGGIAPGDFDRVDGQALAYPVKAGEMLLWSMMEGKKAPTFSARVENGRRAITVPVDEINSISGMLEPGDMIDLIVTLDQKGKKVTFPLLQRVQIIATGQRSVDDPKSGEKRQYSTVTLETTPDQAQNVVVAREAGKITALLRNPQDTQVVASSTDVAALLGLKGESAKADASEDEQVPVLYGGRSGKFSPEDLMLKSMRAAVAARDAKQRQLASAAIAATASQVPTTQGTVADVAQQAIVPVLTNTPEKQP
jgi:pilus assembly protein CpaB